MNESHLHYLFESRKLGNTFQTTEGKDLEVLSLGFLNKSSGPDFLEATLRLDDKIWAGHIEFHLKSSDWLKHGHQNDDAYRNVIAHFVFEHDKEIYSGKYKLPVVELKHIVSSGFGSNMNSKPSKNWIPCEPFIADLDKKLIKSQLILAFENRIQRKRQEAIDLFRQSKNDQRLTLFFLIAKALGGKHNSNAMETLMNKIDFRTINHIGSDLNKIQTYVMGMSGLKATKEFQYLRSLYQLQPMDAVQWKTYGMHPPSQPKNRIKQLASLIANWDRIKYTAALDDWKVFLNSSESSVKIGAKMQESIAINAVVPFLLMLAWFKDDELKKEKAIKILQQIQPENNVIIKGWHQLQQIPTNALESQALIELKNEFCNQKKCLICNVGKKVLKA